MNLSGKKIRIVWHDEDGKEPLPPLVLGPQDRLLQKTYVGHEWCVFDATDGRFEEVITIQGSRQRIEIR